MGKSQGDMGMDSLEELSTCKTGIRNPSVRRVAPGLECRTCSLWSKEKELRRVGSRMQKAHEMSFYTGQRRMCLGKKKKKRTREESENNGEHGSIRGFKILNSSS